MTKVRRRPKGQAPRQQDVDPDIIAAFEAVSVLTPREREVRHLLARLVENEDLELEDDADLDRMSIRLAPELEESRLPQRRARIVANWLLVQPEVVDLYIDDDALSRMVASL